MYNILLSRNETMYVYDRDYRITNLSDEISICLSFIYISIYNTQFPYKYTCIIRRRISKNISFPYRTYYIYIHDFAYTICCVLFFNLNLRLHIRTITIAIYIYIYTNNKNNMHQD